MQHVRHTPVFKEDCWKISWKKKMWSWVLQVALFEHKWSKTANPFMYSNLQHEQGKRKPHSHERIDMETNKWVFRLSNMFYIFPCSPPEVSGIEQTTRTVKREVVLSGEKITSGILDSALYCLYLSLRPQNILDIAHFHEHIGHKQRRI